MTKISVFTISFDRLDSRYHGGEMLTGYLYLEVTKTVKIKGLRIKFYGQANVEWTEQREAREPGEGGADETEPRTYSAQEAYLSREVQIKLSPANTGKVKLTPNRYKYPFSFQLPTNIPGTFSGLHGSIGYWAKAYCVIPWGFDKTCQRGFTIVAHRDLNAMQNARLPQHIVKQQTLCCLCCESQPIDVSLKVERTGYVVGETIPLAVAVNNNSSRRIKSCKLSLVQNITYRAGKVTNPCVYSLANSDHPEIQPGDSIHMSETLDIPPEVQPTDGHGTLCSIIDINYIIRLKVFPAGPAKEIELSLGIIIGTVPFRDLWQGQPLPTYASPPQVVCQLPMQATAPPMYTDQPHVVIHQPQAQAAGPVVYYQGQGQPYMYQQGQPPPEYSAQDKVNIGNPGGQGQSQSEKPPQDQASAFPEKMVW